MEDRVEAQKPDKVVWNGNVQQPLQCVDPSRTNEGCDGTLQHRNHPLLDQHYNHLTKTKLKMDKFSEIILVDDALLVVCQMENICLN